MQLIILLWLYILVASVFSDGVRCYETLFEDKTNFNVRWDFHI